MVFSLFMLAAAYAASVTQLVVLRFLAGMGMGAAMPQTSTVLSEYAPFASAWLIPQYGWRAAFMFVGLPPLALAPLLVLFLPDSARLLALRGASSHVGRHLSCAIGARISGDERFAADEPPLAARQPVSILFSDGYARTTIGLWVTYFMGLMAIELLTGWMPKLMKDAGLSIFDAANITAMFQVWRTNGAIVVGWRWTSLAPR